MKIEQCAFEELVRDSERLRAIETMVRVAGTPPSPEIILALCGYVPDQDITSNPPKHFMKEDN